MEMIFIYSILFIAMTIFIVQSVFLCRVYKSNLKAKFPKLEIGTTSLFLLMKVKNQLSIMLQI